MTKPTFTKEYKSKNRKNIIYTYTLTTYLPNEDEGIIILNNVASTKRKVYVEYPECYIEIMSPSGSINAHHLSDEKQFKVFLYNWSNVWGADFWEELKGQQLI